MRIVVFALLISGVVARADDKDEVKKLEGTWEVTFAEGGGKEIPKGKGAPEKFVIAGAKLTGFGPELKIGTDATKKPKWLNMTFSRDGVETTINAIYSLDGDELKICIPLAPVKGSGKAFENKRPEGFDTKDKPEMMIKLKKAK